MLDPGRVCWDLQPEFSSDKIVLTRFFKSRNECWERFSWRKFEKRTDIRGRRRFRLVDVPNVVDESKDSSGLWNRKIGRR